MGIFCGIIIGLMVGFIFAIWMLESYKRVLIMKSHDGTAECIDGKFYYIKGEGK